MTLNPQEKEEGGRILFERVGRRWENLASRDWKWKRCQKLLLKETS